MGERIVHEQAILAEIPWLRQLARDLTRDRIAREDLVQETCWIALTRPPRERERAPLRAWLRTVIRNASLLAQRTRRRAEVREHSIAREEAVEPVDEIVARAELQRRLLAEVLALRRPMREALILRYYRGLDTATIARELGLSDEAVRQRHVRALAALRERTRDDADLRDLMSIAGVLRPAARHSMDTLRWAAAACCALIAAVWIPQSASSDPGAETHSRLLFPSVESSEATAAVANAGSAIEMRAPAQEPTPLAPWLALEVREARDHAALSGVSIARARAKSWDELAADVDATFERLGIAGRAGRFLSLSKEESLPAQPGTDNLPPFAPRDESVIATTDREGRASLSAKLPAEEFLVIRCPGHGARFISVADALRLAPQALTIDLHPLGKLPVRVHTLEDEAIDEAFLRLEAVPFLPEFQPQPTMPLVDGLAWRGPTDEQGKFELLDVPLDESLFITPLSRYIGKPEDLLLPAGAPIQPLDLVVIAAGAISGRLVDSKGNPIVDGTVLCNPRSPWNEHFGLCSTDEDGAFKLPELPAGPQTLNYSATPASRMAFAWGDRGREIVVEPFANIDLGEIVLESRPICRGRVIGIVDHGLLRAGLELIQLDKRTRATFAEDGIFEVQGEVGPARLELSLDIDWSRGPVVAAWDVVLPCEKLELDVSSQLASITFGLEPSSATPPKLDVRLYDRATYSANGSPHWEGAVTRHQVELEDGRYRIAVLAPGNYHVEIQGPESRDAWTADLPLQPGHATDLGAIRLGTGTLEGSLRAGHGKAEVSCLRRGVGEQSHDMFDRRSASVGDDGSFRIADLPAGLWCLTASLDGAPVTDGVVVDLRVGKTERVDLTASKAGSIRCRIRKGDVPVVGAQVQWGYRLDGELRPFFELNPRTVLSASDAEGRIDLGSFFPGSYAVTIQTGDGVLTRHVDIGWGEQVELEFDTAWKEVAVSLELPPEWLTRLSLLSFSALETEGESAGLMVRGRRTGLNTFMLRAPPSRGYVEFYLEAGDFMETVQWPLTIRADQPSVSLSMPPGEVVVQVGGGGERGTWGLPEICAVELTTGKIAGCDSWLDHWPLESQGDGRWLARGIPAGATLQLQDGSGGRAYGSVPRRVRFESGRLELKWP